MSVGLGFRLRLWLRLRLQSEALQWEFGSFGLRAPPGLASPYSAPHVSLGANPQSALNTLGETIDSKTATPEKPGLYTQASTAASKGIASIQKAVAEVNSVDLATAYGHPSAGVAGAGVGAGVGASVAAGQAGTGVSAATGTGALATGAPVPAVGTSAAAPHPVMTTTNTVAHNSKDADPL